MADPKTTIVRAVVASVCVAPRDPWLTRDELHEIGKQLGVPWGALDDAIKDQVSGHGNLEPVLGTPRLKLQSPIAMISAMFHTGFEPGDPRKPEAFDAVLQCLWEQEQQVGHDNAWVDRDALVARATKYGVSDLQADAAITMMAAGQILAIDKSGRVNSRSKFFSPPNGQHARDAARQHVPNPNFSWPKCVAAVTDVIARRGPGRHASADAITAFGAVPKKLGHAYFGDWWRQLRTEANQGNDGTPTTVIVLSAAMCEGALCLIVDTAQKAQLSMVKHLAADHRLWRFQDLLAAARTGSAPVITDEALYQRCVKLNTMRQRIHVGRILAEPENYPQPDARPEEAQEARAVTQLLVRAILDWLETNKLLPA